MANFFDMYFGATKWSDGLSCQVCLAKYKIFAEFKRHISSKEHQKKMTQVFQTEDHSIPGKLPPILIMDRSIQLTIQQPILGLQLLTVCFSRGVGNVLYLCHVCEETVPDHKILDHLTSGCHEFIYYSYADANMLEVSWIPCEDVRVNPGMRKMLEHSNVSGVGPLKMLNLPYRLVSLYESYSYFQVMHALTLYDKLPTLLQVDVKPKKVPVQQYQEDPRKNHLPLDPSEKSYKIHCQNCKLPLDTPEQYFRHVQNKKHKMMVLSIHGNVHSSFDTEGMKGRCDHRAAVAESQTLEQLLFDELDKRSVPGAAMMVLCYSSELVSEVVCICCACHDAFSKSLLTKHLKSHKHLLQTLLHLNPWRLPFGWQNVPERKFLKAKVEAEEKERGWTQVVLKVMDLPGSVLRSIIPPSYQKVMDRLSRRHVVLKRNVPPCQTFSQLQEHKTYPLLGRSFMVSHESYDPARDSAYDSMMCLLCRRRLTHQEGYAHAFSWEHVAMFLERFHPGSLRPHCDTKELLDLATQAARIHSVSHVQKLKLERPVEEPCDYVKVKVILSAAKRRNSKSPLMPLVLPQAPLVPAESATAATPGCSTKSNMATSPSRKTHQNPANTSRTATVDETGQQRSARVWMSANDECERKRPSAPQDDEIGYKRQRRDSREIAEHEEKPKIKYESWEQKETVPVAASTESTLCTTNTNVTLMVASAKFTATKSAASTASCTTKPGIATTSSSTKPCVTAAFSGAPAFAAKSMAPSAGTAQCCRVTETYSSVTWTTTKSIASTVSTTQACKVIATSSSATSTTQRSTASATSCTTTSARVTASPTKSTVPTIIYGPTACTFAAPSTLTKPTETTTAIRDAKISTLPTATPVMRGARTSTVIHGATATKPATPNAIHGATTSMFTSTAESTTPVARCVGSASEFAATISHPKNSFTGLSVRHKAPKERTERARRSSWTSGTNPESALKTPVPSHAGVATAAVAAPKCRKSESSAKKVSNTWGSHDDAEPRAEVRRAITTAKLSHSRTKLSLLKVGLSFIVAVNSDGRKQSYCTLCRIRLECSSHPTEKIHRYNYMKRRFPELNDKQLARINQEKFAFSMTEVEKCLGLRNFQTIEVTNDEYKELSDLPEDQALQRLETHFLVLSNTLVPLGHVSPTSFDGRGHLNPGSSFLRGALGSQLSIAQEFDTETHARTAAGPTTEPEATVHSIHGYECGKEACEQQEIGHDALKFAEDNLDGFEEPLSSVSFGPDPQIDHPGLKDAEKNAEGSDEPSPSVLLGPVLKFGDSGSQDNKENLSGFNEPSPAVSLGPEPHFHDPCLNDVEVNLEGSDCPSPSELLGPEPQFGKPGLKRGGEDLEGCNRSSLGTDLGPASVNAEPQSPVVRCSNDGRSSLHKVPIDAGSNCGHSASQAPILSGSPSNLTTFLWVKGPSNQPVIGLVSVYECHGTFGNSFYLCQSCSQKLLVGEICQHMVSATHRLAYMLRAYPQYMDAFWYEEDIGEEMKLELLNDVAINIAAQERSKKMDAKVIDLSQDMYEYIWNAPFGEALDVLQSATRQPVVASQQTANQTSEKQSGHEMDSGADSVPSTSSARTNLSPQETRKSSPIPPELPISGVFSRTPPVFKVKSEPMLLESKPPVSPGPTCEEQARLQVKAELMPQESATAKAISEEERSSQVKAELIGSECRPAETFVSVTKTPPVFQVKSEPMLLESKPPVSPGPTCEEQASLQVKAELMPPESVTAKAISEELRSSQVKAELIPPESGSGATAAKPNFQVKVELMLPESKSPETAGPVSEEPHSFHVKAELKPEESGSPETAGRVPEEQPSFQVNTELLPENSRSPESAGTILEKQPGYQVNAELTFSECSSPVTTTMLKTPQFCQVKDEVVLLGCGSPVTAGPGSETLPSSKVKAETLFSEYIPAVSNASISKTQQSSQVKDDRMRSKSRTPVTATPVTKMSSTFQVKEQARSEGVARVTTSPTIRQDEYLPTRKRESLESLDELIRICTSKTQLCDPRPAKWRPKSLLAKSPDVNPPLIPGEPAPVDQGASVVENRNSEEKFPPKVDDCIAAIAGNPAAKVSHMTSAQPITTIVTSKSRWDRVGPSTTPGIQRVAPDPHLSSSSPKDTLVMEDKSTNTTIPRDPDWVDGYEVKPLLADNCVSSSPDQVAVPQGNANASPFSANGVQNCKLDRDSQSTLSGAKSDLSDAPLSNSSDSGLGNLIPCVTNMHSRYAPAAEYRAPISFQTVNENVGQSHPVQVYLQQTANHFTVPLVAHHQTVMGWANQQTPQWMPQQQYPTTWVQTARNVTNGATYLCTFPFAPAAYSARPLALVPVSSQGNGTSSQPSYNALTLAQLPQKK
ncbi:uncharacterized protein LOC133470699 isoform X3 [Phyllopteryx taeniolatus]|uniref:uncharacterized protein LOC133470699 isoform X3 n=1 Tax=Phyllopteryx taeniolatus TaxID=161469 RepID=UPI002AD2C62E|nr:uncharacterized protein LOC133470699 isoform X3 [Phyllopteryx taeniolatus]